MESLKPLRRPVICHRILTVEKPLVRSAELKVKCHFFFPSAADCMRLSERHGLRPGNHRGVGGGAVFSAAGY